MKRQGKESLSAALRKNQEIGSFFEILSPFTAIYSILVNAVNI